MGDCRVRGGVAAARFEKSLRGGGRLKQPTHFIFILLAVVALLAELPQAAIAADTANDKTPLPVVSAHAVEDNSTGVWLQVADYAQGENIPFSVVGTLPSDIEARDEFAYWLVAELESGLAYVEGSARLSLVCADGTTQDITAQLTTRREGAVVSVGASNLKAIAADIAPEDRLQLTYEARFTDQAYLGLARGNYSFAHVEYSPAEIAATRGSPAQDSAMVAQVADKLLNPGLDRTQSVRATVYCYRINVRKIAEGSDGTPLAGATFALRDAEGKWFVAGGDWAFSQQDATKVTTDEQGSASFVGLDSETYELVELSAPEGYKLANPIDVALEATVSETADTTLKAVSKAAAVITADAGTGIVSVTVSNAAVATAEKPAAVEEPPASPLGLQARSSDVRPASAKAPRFFARTGDVLPVIGLAVVALAAFALVIALAMRRRMASQVAESSSATHGSANSPTEGSDE